MEDWKSSFITGAARAVVAGRLLACLRYLDAGQTESVRQSLLRLHWRDDIDLTGVPASVVDQTDRMCTLAARNLTRPGENVDRAKRTLLDVIDLW